MKKSNKALAALLITGLLFAGCSKDSGTSSEAYELKDVTFPLEEAVSLKFMTQSSPLAPTDPNEKLIYKRLAEKTGVNIEWKNYTSDSFIEKRNLTVASGDLPDAILDAGYSDYDLQKLGKDGTIIPVEDLIDQYMPNFKKVLEDKTRVQIYDYGNRWPYLCISMD